MTTVQHATAQLKVWEKVEIITGEGDQAGHYLARIQDFLNGGIVITEPEFLHGNSLLTENAHVRVIITREDAVYEFSSTVRRSLSQARQQYLLTPPRHIDRVQRRLFVRVDITKRMTWAKVPSLAEWQSLEDRARWTQTSTADISGGGLLFRADQPIDRNARILVRVSLFKEIGLPETAAAVVMRSFTRKNEYFCGAAFILAEHLSRHFNAEEQRALPRETSLFDINAQNRLVSHIFQIQVTMRQKGLL